MNARCVEAEARLFPLAPRLPGGRVARGMFVSREVHAAISRTNDLRFGKLRADLDGFTQGLKISVAEDPFNKEKTAYIARVDPVADEVWQIRSRDPSPGIRVFGHFAAKNIFVALTWRYRTELGDSDSKEWRDEINRCKAEWRRLFHPYKPHRGKHVSDYIPERYRLS